MLVLLLKQLSLEPVIVAAIVSAVVALAILGFREGYLEPKRTRDKINRETLEKKVAAYGTILTLLETFEKRARERPLQISHLFSLHDEFPGIQRAIGRSRHLLSDKLSKTWVNAAAKFTFEITLTIGGQTYVYEDLRDLQTIVTEEFVELKKRYDEL
ncbi:MAG TPA: hypothetical protein VGQ13_06575 [Nitrososphaera sp.]|nr:hypothetical protein [Nitrososphaera sp.]